MSKKEFKNISHFEKYSDEIRGTNEKEWLLTPNKLLCLYKITQIRDDNTSTNAHYSESIYSEICKLLKVDCCEIDLVQSNKRKGIISYYFLNKNEELIDFNALIQNIRQDFVPKSLKCKKTHEYYSINLILEAIKAVVYDRDQYRKIIKNLFELILIDALCDHYDRNSSNLSLIRNYDVPRYPCFRLAPVYDNGTSLWVCLPLHVAQEYLEKENGIEELDNRVISKIGTGTQRGSSYSELLRYIFENYIDDFEEIISLMTTDLNEETITNILFQKKYKNLDPVYKKLIIVKLLYNKHKILTLYKTYKNSNVKKISKQLLKRSN